MSRRDTWTGLAPTARIVTAMTDRSDRFRGCLLGGALGDALGAPVEFDATDAILARFGPGGVDRLVPAYGILGAVTDDTQMAMATADGLLRARRGEADGDAVAAVRLAYLDWYAAQTGHPPSDRPLYGEPWMRASRAPGTTCLSALGAGAHGAVAHPINTSKGCGGVMRVAPVGLACDEPFRVGAAVAALTHGHPSGYLPAGVLAALVASLVHDGASLREAVPAARAELVRWPGHEETAAALDAAVMCASQGRPQPEDLERLGGGWTGEEALAIALGCALACGDDVRGALTAAVTHSGDSDSTGAICGNLLGAAFGVAALPGDWLADLEGAATITHLADELAS